METVENIETRKLARVEKILALDPIPDADLIETATVGGWRVVVRKGLYHVGDLAVYFEIDSKIKRVSWSEFLFKSPKISEDETYRLRSIRLKRQLSQGLLVPIAEIPEIKGMTLAEGDNLTEVLGIRKYEPVIPAQLAGLVKGNFPRFMRKTDESRLQSNSHVLDEIKGVDLYISVKCDGSSLSAYRHEGVFGVCSRNLDLKEEGGDAYWAMVKSLGLQDKLPEGYSIAGELAGPGIQGNRLGLSEKKLYIFSVFDIAKQKFLDYSDFIAFCAALKLETVPIHSVTNAELTMDQWLALAESVNYPNGTPAEGIVVRPLFERYSEALKGRLSFKVISNKFLLKYNE